MIRDLLSWTVAIRRKSALAGKTRASQKPAILLYRVRSLTTRLGALYSHHYVTLSYQRPTERVSALETE